MLLFHSQPYSRRCSTPEGIGAATTRRPIQQENRRRWCAQRPKASERRRQAAGRLSLARQAVLNARRHRSGDDTSASLTGHPTSRRAQRPKASERRRPVGDLPAPSQRIRCSTPEGIGAATTVIAMPFPSGPFACSTPEGIGAATTSNPDRSSLRTPGAQRPKASERRRHLRARVDRVAGRCSTPEGIGAATTASRCAQGPRAWVLNARRHRSGDDAPTDPPPGWRPPVLNARRHRSGDDRSQVRRASRSPGGCSTPEGIGAATTPLAISGPRAPQPVLNARRHRSGDDRSPSGSSCPYSRVLNARRHRSGDDRRDRPAKGARAVVLNARRHRSGDDRRGSVVVGQRGMCSTPEGIGAATTRRALASTLQWCGAQRPKASERRRPLLGCK